MAINYYEGRTLEWLLERRTAIQDIMAGGSGVQTHVGIAPGIFHEFEAMNTKQLEEQLLRILYALFCLDPALYPNPYARFGQTTPIFTR